MERPEHDLRLAFRCAWGQYTASRAEFPIRHMLHVSGVLHSFFEHCCSRMLVICHTLAALAWGRSVLCVPLVTRAGSKSTMCADSQ